MYIFIQLKLFETRYSMSENKKKLVFIWVNRGFEFKTGVKK